MDSKYLLRLSFSIIVGPFVVQATTSFPSSDCPSCPWAGLKEPFLVGHPFPVGHSFPVGHPFLATSYHRVEACPSFPEGHPFLVGHPFLATIPYLEPSFPALVVALPERLAVMSPGTVCST